MNLITHFWGHIQTNLKFHYFYIWCKSSVPSPYIPLSLFLPTPSRILPFPTDKTIVLLSCSLLSSRHFLTLWLAAISIPMQTFIASTVFKVAASFVSMLVTMATDLSSVTVLICLIPYVSSRNILVFLVEASSYACSFTVGCYKLPGTCWSL